MAETQCQSSDATGPGWGPEMFFSSKIPGDTNVASARTVIENQ